MFAVCVAKQPRYPPFLCSAVGPSQDASGVNIIDAILVYGQTKTAFGWPEDASEATPPAKSPSGGPAQNMITSATSREEEEEEEVEVGENMAAAPLTHLGR